MGLMRNRKLEDEYAKIFDDLGFEINVEKEEKEIEEKQENSQKK